MFQNAATPIAGTSLMINAKLLQLLVDASNDGIVVAEQEGEDRYPDLRQCRVRTPDRLRQR